MLDKDYDRLQEKLKRYIINWAIDKNVLEAIKIFLEKGYDFDETVIFEASAEDSERVKFKKEYLSIKPIIMVVHKDHCEAFILIRDVCDTAQVFEDKNGISILH